MILNINFMIIYSEGFKLNDGILTKVTTRNDAKSTYFRVSSVTGLSYVYLTLQI